MGVTDDQLQETNLSLRMLAEHVLSAARHAATGRIGLTVVDGGIATPAYGEAGQIVAVIDGRLVCSDSAGRREAEITTLRAAADFVGIDAGAPTDVYQPSTACELDAPLVIDRAAFDEIAGWYATVNAALHEFAERADPTKQATATLWPEHFDVAIRLDDVNYGGLAGDDWCRTPYVYVGPDPAVLPDPRQGFWNASFGASRSRDEVGSVAEIVAFFEEGQAAARALQSGAVA